MNPLAIVEIGAKLLDKIIPDKDARDRAQAELLKAAQDQDFQLTLAQLEINKIEAASGNWFVNSWRPAVGWVCVVGLLWHFILQPVCLFFITLFGIVLPALPSFDMDTLMTLLFGLLGMGALRTVEKTKGVARNSL